ncbi:MAG: hypothetical protein ACYTFI_25080, partial [Planctomycetota bacterium]
MALAVVDGGGELVASAGPAPHRGRPLGALGELLEGAGEDVQAAVRSADRALAAGTGSALIAEAVSAGEVSVVVAAADAAGRLVPGAGSVILVGAEDAFLALLDGAEPRDVRSPGPCGFGAGWLLSRWAPDGADPEAVASLGESIPAGCGRVADEALAKLRLRGAAPEMIAAQAVGAAARLLVSELVRGGPVDLPVALVGGPATTPGLSRALEEALGLADGSVIVPDLAELAVAIGAARLARALGRPPDLPAEWPAARDGAASPSPPPHAEASTLVAYGPFAALGMDIGLGEVRGARCDSAGRLANSERVPLRGAGSLGAAGEFLGLVPAAVTGNLADHVARELGARPLTRAEAIARFAASRGASSALDIGASESCLVRLDTDGRLEEASYPAPCGRGLGRALEDVARALGLPDPAVLG